MKPHKGTIVGVRKDIPGLELYPNLYPKNLGYIITGHFKDHHEFAGMLGWTSLIVKKGPWSAFVPRTCEVETLNSRYTWVEAWNIL